MTVPLARRIRKAGGEGYVIHHQHLRPEQATWWEGIRTVTPLTAIEQALTSGVPTYLLREAIIAAYKKAMIRDAEPPAFDRAPDAKDLMSQSPFSEAISKLKPKEKEPRRWAGDSSEVVTPPSLAGFGLPTPDTLATLALRFQIAQEFHACTDPHDPPAAITTCEKRTPPPASWPMEASYPAPRRDGSGVGAYWGRAQLGQDLFLR